MQKGLKNGILMFFKKDRYSHRIETGQFSVSLHFEQVDSEEAVKLAFS
jgi:hypothetical protein